MDYLVRKTHLGMTEKTAFNKIKMKTLIKPSKKY